MMKKVLALMLVLGMASLANATVIDVIPVGPGDAGHMGTSSDPLDPGETIQLQIVLNWVPDSFPGGTYPSYDGYVLRGMDLSLTASSGGTMGVNLDKKGKADWGENSDWSLKGSPTIVSNVLDTGGAYASLAETLGETLGIDTWDGDENITTPLLWNFYWTCDGTNEIVTLTWGLAEEPGQYYDYVGDGIVEDPVAKDLTLSDMGGIAIIHQIPEPMTIALLGLGGLFLRRRR